MINKKQRVIILMFILLIMCVGCSSKKDKKDEIQSKLQEENSATGSASNITSDSRVEKYAIESTTSNAKIYVDATIPEYDQSELSVYKQESTVVNDEVIAKLAKEIFGEEYTILKPYGVYTWEELNVAEAENNKIISSYGSDTVPFPVVLKSMRVEFYKGNYKEEFAMEKMPEGQILCPVDQSFGFVSYEDGEKKEGLIEGVIDGETWHLRVVTISDKYILQLVRIVDGLEETEYNYNNYNEDNEVAELVYGKNSCKYSQEEAEITAESFAQGIGYDNLKVIKTLQLAGTAGGSEDELNGYLFVFARAKDGLATASKYYNPFFYLYNELERGGQDMIFIYVGDNGIYKVRVGMQTSITEVGGEATSLIDAEDGESLEIQDKNITLLDIEKIKMIAKEYLEKYVINSLSSDINITNIELRYASVFIPESGTYLMPVWFYFAKESNNLPYIGINALDDSIVYSYSQNGLSESRIINAHVNFETMEFY